MPFYDWLDHDTKTVITVFRPVSAYDIPPRNDEYNVLEHPAPEWERLMPSGTSWKQAPGYRAGGKGAKGGFNPKTTKHPPQSL